MFFVANFLLKVSCLLKHVPNKKTFYKAISIYKHLVNLGVKDSVVIWAKLKQGNGRGTCCWIKHNSRIYITKYIKKIYNN